MRKTVLLVAVLLFMAVPAMAASTVDITCTKTVVVDVTWVTVSYSSDHNRIRAFGLDITLTPADGNIVDVNVLDPCGTKYRIYPGQINIDTEGEVTDYNKPYAFSDFNDHNNVIAVEMGSLYTTDTSYASDANAGFNKIPGLYGDLLKFAYKNATGYTVDVNVRRGGIVMEDPCETPSLDSPLCSSGGGTCTVPPIVGLSSTDANTAILAAQLTVGNRVGKLSCEPLNKVLEQSPPSGTQVACQSAVDYNYSLYQATVPNVVGMKQADANAALIAAGFTVGNITVSSDCGTAGDFNVISSTPAGGSAATCGLPVDMVRCECYAGQADYAQWEAAGKPICWCYPRQCHGDADGKKQGSAATGYMYVGSNDLDIMSLGWKVLDPTKGPGILNLQVNGVPVACADFKHDRQGSAATGYMRIGSNDLDEMSIYWKVLEPTKGPGTPTNCPPGNRNP